MVRAREPGRVAAAPRGRDDQRGSRHRPSPAPLSSAGVVLMQRTVGNRAVAGVLGVQRQPDVKVPIDTWRFEEPYRGRTVMHRSTKIEASAWGEVGPRPPRITYRQEVHVETADGVTIYLDVRGTIQLPPGTALPTSPEAALAVIGALGHSQHSFRIIERGESVAVPGHSDLKVPGTSMRTLSARTLPDYAAVALTPAQQETAILRFLDGLKRRDRSPQDQAKRGEGKPKDKDKSRSTLKKVVGLGTDVAPIIGEIKDAIRALTGRDPDTGDRIPWWGRLLAALFAIPVLGKALKGIKWLAKGGKYLVGLVVERLARWIGKARSRRLAGKSSKALKAGATTLDDLRRLTRGAGTSNGGWWRSTAPGRPAPRRCSTRGRRPS